MDGIESAGPVISASQEKLTNETGAIVAPAALSSIDSGLLTAENQATQR